LKITFELDFSLFELNTLQLNNYFQPIQNSEEPTFISFEYPTLADGVHKNLKKNLYISKK